MYWILVFNFRISLFYIFVLFVGCGPGILGIGAKILGAEFKFNI